MIPFDVPSAIVADTAIHVGVPKLRLPPSENSWLLIFLSFVHRTTSHGADRSSSSSIEALSGLLAAEGARGRPPRNGDSARGDSESAGPAGCNRDWKRRSNGRNDGEGENMDPAALPTRDDDATES